MFRQYKLHLRPLLLLFGAFFIARILFITLMPATYSYDLLAWLDVIKVLKANGNPYSLGTLNWPPFWMQMLYCISRIADFTGITTTRLIQSVLILFEGVNMLLIYYIIRKHFPSFAPFKVLLWGMALNPVCILLSCQHCNFDVIVGCWILLCTMMMLDYHRSKNEVSWLLACFFVGMGVLTKTIPVMLTPVLFINSLKGVLRTKLFGLVLIFMPVLIGMSVLFPLASADVSKYVLGYRSMCGWYGITGIIQMVISPDVMKLYATMSPWLLISFMFFIWYRYRQVLLSAQQIIMLPLIILLFITTFGPGYSPPYLLWFLPLILILFNSFSKSQRCFIVAGYIIIILTYVTEYACFESHGAFLTYLMPTVFTISESRNLSTWNNQVLIRLPMFGWYVAFFFMLMRELKTNKTIAQPLPQ